MSYKEYKFVYFGSPRFSRIVLENIMRCNLIPDILVCNPDKPVGRKKIITPPETKILLKNKKAATEILQPKNKKELEFMKDRFSEMDFGIVAAYSKIIPEEIIKKFKLGIIGVHPSILPKYRGPSPIQYAILNGEKNTGTTLFILDSGVDSGPIIASREIEIKENDNYLSLEMRLAELGAKMLCEFIDKFLNNEANLKNQDDAQATYTKKINTEDGFVNLEKDDPEIIYRKIKALNPEPGVFAFINGVRTKLNEAKKENGEIIITKVTPAGKKMRESNIILKK